MITRLAAARTGARAVGSARKYARHSVFWIVRGNDPNTGRPVPDPEAFFIDIDICMNCGYCAEYCPFDGDQDGP